MAEPVRPSHPIDIVRGRARTHGSFRDNGRIMQALKKTMRDFGINWNVLPDYQKEALEMVQHKVGRILSGDPTFLDHWDDIAGYAIRVSEIIQEDQPKTVIDRAVGNSPPPLDDVGGIDVEDLDEKDPVRLAFQKHRELRDGQLVAQRDGQPEHERPHILTREECEKKYPVRRTVVGCNGAQGVNPHEWAAQGHYPSAQVPE